MNQLQIHWKKILIIAIIVIFVPIAIIIIINIMKNATVLVYVSPVNATVTIDGQNYTNGTYKMFPGEKNVSISSPDFETKTFQINFQANQKTDVMTFLHPSKNNYVIYRKPENYESFNVLQQLTGQNSLNSQITNQNITIDNDQSASQFFKECEKIISIKQYFPIIEWFDPSSPEFGKSSGFKIEDGSSYGGCLSSFCLGVSYYAEQNQNKVNEKIKSLGYNPNDYQIIYKKAL